MCKSPSYSKYQKKVIKGLFDFLGTETPFTYERAQNNHLKVLIDGLLKPMYTGSTPSDSKSYTNFMSEVKREVRQSRLKAAESVEGEVESKPKPQINPICFDKLIQNCVKSLRSRLDTLKSQEEDKVLSAKDVLIVNEFRETAIKRAVKLALEAKRSSEYIKPKDMRIIESVIGKHLNFMMPTLACYTELLSKKDKFINTTHTIEPVDSFTNSHTSELDDIAITCDDKTQIDKITQTNDDAKLKIKLPSKKKTSHPSTSTNASISTSAATVISEPSAKSEKSDPIVDLMSMSTENRVNMLRSLTKAQAHQLIEDINEALTLNREDDIAAVIKMIKEKDLSLDLIISRLDAV